MRDRGSAQGEAALEHTFGPDCLCCGDGRSGTRCDHFSYSPRRVRFILAHREAYDAAHFNSNRAAASNELARLEREYRTLPPRHSCSCPRMNPRTGIVDHHCLECRRLAEEIPKQDVAVEIGRGTPPGSRVPMPLMLDLARAEAVLGKTDDAVTIARYMSLDGAAGSVRPVQLERRRTSSATELVCLMCARSAAPGEQRCQWCGGSVVADEALSS